MMKKPRTKPKPLSTGAALWMLEGVARKYYEEDLLWIEMSHRKRNYWDQRLRRALEAVDGSFLELPITPSTDITTGTNNLGVSNVRIYRKKVLPAPSARRRKRK